MIQHHLGFFAICSADLANWFLRPSVEERTEGRECFSQTGQTLSLNNFRTTIAVLSVF